MVFFRNKRDVAQVQRPQVLVQVDDFVSGGLETVVQDINHVLLAQGFAVTLLVLGQAGPALAQARQSGVRVLQIPRRERSYSRMLRKLAPDAVLAHYSCYGVQTCNAMQIPFVQVIHNTYCWFDPPTTESFNRAAAATRVFVAVSAAVRDYTLRHFSVSAAQCMVIPNGIDTEKFSAVDQDAARSALRSRYGFAPDDVVLLAVGAINPQKNHAALVQAVASMQAECPDLRVLIAGRAADPALVQDLQHTIAENKLQDRVVWAGAVDTMPELYAAADVFVATSLFEGGQLALLEALVAGKPVVTTDVGFARHLYAQPGCTVVPIVDGTVPMEALQNALRKVMQNPVAPDLGPAVIQALDRTQAYEPYAQLLRQLADVGTYDETAMSPGWPACLQAKPSLHSAS